MTNSNYVFNILNNVEKFIFTYVCECIDSFQRKEKTFTFISSINGYRGIAFLFLFLFFPLKK